MRTIMLLSLFAAGCAKRPAEPAAAPDATPPETPAAVDPPRDVATIPAAATRAEPQVDPVRVTVESHGYLGDSLNIRLNVEVTDPDRLVKFVSWGAGGAAAVDSKGNELQPLASPEPDRWTGTLRPGSPAKPLVSFAKPVASAEWVDVRLSKWNVNGGRGSIVVRVPLR